MSFIQQNLEKKKSNCIDLDFVYEEENMKVGGVFL